ncbi:ribosome rescue protein RqcH [Halorhabdus sp. CUG00001]|uniref:ribosome rescue protein RqcH n=1 Tax=Halorhabdus sp. CUG00001 TaxID=2600297 RepID=UPI00131D5E93|nr:ribosome rescue protein RqcH [Halorhabdus sp. CUG00001]
MDRKRELTSVDCAALAGELSQYTGAHHDKSYLYDDDLLRLKLSGPNFGRIELLVQVDDPKRVHTMAPERVPDAPERPPNFAMMLRNRLDGSKLAAVEQFEFDRILTFRFERTDDHTTIVAELFGDGNVVILDETDTVIDSFETVRLQSRTVAPGGQYEFPEARFNPLTVEYEDFLDRMSQSDADVVRTLATQLNFGGLYGEELCSRADVPYNQPIADTTEAEFEALYESITALSERLQAGDLDPRLYHEDEEPVDATPVPLREYDHLDSERYDSFTAALEAYFRELDRAEDEQTGGSDRPDFQAEIEKQQRIIQQQEQAIEDFEADAERERERAQLLYANYDLVDDVLSTIQDARAAETPWDEIESTLEAGKEQGIPAATAVRDVDGSRGTVTIELEDHRIELEADTGVEKNADRLYQEAKRIEAKKAGAEDAIAETREQLEAVKQRREAWEAEESEDGDDEQADEDVDWLSRDSIPVRQSETWYDRFRWFRTSDDFLVIGGRNADHNEELVKKYLDRGDLFFHTQAHGAPATILKATGPSEAAPDDLTIPERSREEAAQFAVSYSTLWKDGKYAGDVYSVDSDQVTKTPESGEYLEKGSFAIRGDRTYYDDTPVGVAVGITCEPETRVVGGPPSAIRDQAETSITVEPGRFAQNDIGKKLYREFKGRFADETFVRKVASPDLIQEFLPPGGSRMVEE